MDRTDPMAHNTLIDIGHNPPADSWTVFNRGPNQMSDREQESKQTLLRFDSRVFSLSAVKKAAYKYINSFTADINLVEDLIVCTLSFASPANEERSSMLIEEFKKEVLDQDLRERIKTETEPIRSLIFALAFSKTGIAGNEQVSRD